jgi:hypothetical protein
LAATPHDTTGTVLTWAGTTYTVTNIVITNENPAADDNIDVSHLGLTAGNSVLTMSRPLAGATGDTGRSVQFDYLGKTVIADASTGTISITTGGTTLLNAVNGTVQSSTLTLTTNDAIRGQATIRIARV